MPVIARLPFSYFRFAASGHDQRMAAEEFVAVCELVERAGGSVRTGSIPFTVA